VEDIQADTNILLRSVEPAHPTHQQAVNSVKTLLANGDRVCLIPQNLIEFWNVATRPIDKNGFGWSPAKTDAEITRLESLLTVLPDNQSIYQEWRKLVLDNSVLGKQVHDARIVAAMNVHQITKLLTFNLKDFRRFQQITLLDPNIF
jgi:predicted nucleic acid-binding protein